METDVNKRMIIMIGIVSIVIVFSLFALCWNILQENQDTSIHVNILNMEVEENKNISLTVIKKTSSGSKGIVYNGVPIEYTLELTDGNKVYSAEVNEKAYNFLEEGSTYDFVIVETVSTLELK